MDNVTYRPATYQDIPQIIDLQIENHIQNSDRTEKRRGFLTLLTTSEILKYCVDYQNVFVAIYNEFPDWITGYIIVMNTQTADNIVFLQPFLQEIYKIQNIESRRGHPECTGFTDDIAILAQIYVEKIYRRCDIGRSLLMLAQSKLKEANVKSIFTEVSSENPRSINFHHKNGFIDIKSYGCTGQTFHIIRKDLI